jgi:hypothetical protein
MLNQKPPPINHKQKLTVICPSVPLAAITIKLGWKVNARVDADFCPKKPDDGRIVDNLLPSILHTFITWSSPALNKRVSTNSITRGIEI